MSKKQSDDPDADETAGGSHGDLDAFVLREIFPDAYKLIEFQRTSIDNVLDNAIFLLDTNALLRAYSLKDAALASVGAIYRDLIEGGRFFVPSHAIREFAHRRPQKIKELYQKVADAQRGPLHTTLAAFDQFPEHARIVALETEIADHLAERDNLLKQILATIESWHGDDPVNVLYRDLFREEVVIDPDMDVDALKRDAEQRFNYRIPPGYKDSRKDVNSTGDVLIWHSVLAAGRRAKRDAIIVSGEQKSDWFYRTKGVPLFERLEMIEEYRRASEGRTLHVITFDAFLRHMKADAELLKQAERAAIAQASTESVRGHWGYHAERAVVRWLRREGFETADLNAFPDFFAVREADDKSIYVEVKLASSRPLYVAKATDVLRQAEQDNIEPLVIIFVALAKVNAERALKNLQRFFKRNASRVSDTKIIVGFLEDDGGEFSPVGEVLNRGVEPVD